MFRNKYAPCILDYKCKLIIKIYLNKKLKKKLTEGRL